MSRPTVGTDRDALEPDAAAVHQRLLSRIRSEIEAAGGRIPFARYMELALYAPGLGYYSAGAQRFGRRGDFTTAPETTPLFARCLANQCAQMLAQIPAGQILEFGAGSGRMAADLLNALAEIGCPAPPYAILELSADLRRRQRGTLERLAPRHAASVRWLERMPEPGEFRGVIVANEVLDAMPVARFCIADGQILEGFVVWRDGGLAAQFGRPADPVLVRQVRHIEASVGTFVEGYVSEVCVMLGPWVRALATALEVGAVVIIDYGYGRREYYHPQRTNGTLTCHFRHRVHADPLARVGLQDITASVDFTVVAEAAHDAGLDVTGFATQAEFLIGCGLLELARTVDVGDTERHVQMLQDVKALTLPGLMGERFRVMGLARAIAPGWIGFSGRGLRHTL